MPSSKQRISTSAPVGSPTVKAPPLISKNKATFLAATKKPTLMGTPILCASVNAIVRSATYAQQKAVSRSSSSRRKEHRRSNKSPPPHYVQKLQSQRSGKLARWVFFRHF
jgi:hypothetical protein